MARAPKTRIVDRGATRIIRSAKLTNNVELAVGLFGEDRHANDPFTLPEIGAVNEFGTADGHTPARPFMRTAFDENVTKYNTIIKTLLTKVIDGELRPLQMIDQVGILMVGDIKKKITDIRTPPNAQSTIDTKGFNNPLIRTGLMRNSVKHKIRVK